MTEKNLFVKVGGDYQWTQKQIDNLVKELDEFLPDEIGVIVVPDDVEYLTSDQLEKFGQSILEVAQNE